MSLEGLQQAIEAAQQNVMANAGGPFGACLTLADKASFVGANHVVPEIDVTSHAEVNAIRSFIRDKGYSFLGAEEKAALFSSCECCPMCMAMALTVGVSEIVYANTREDADAIGFSDNIQYKFLRKNPTAKIIFAEEAEDILNRNQADFLIFDANDDLITASQDGAPEDLGLASVSGVRKACQSLQKFWLPEGFYIVARKIPHPMGLVAADWAKVLRPDDEAEIVPYQLICATHDYETPILTDKNGKALPLDNAEMIYNVIAGKEKPAAVIRRTEDKEMRKQALDTFHLFAHKVRNNNAEAY
ncbi:MAG: nucleoside deaminase [Alphaproteobacteria bacterium]|nr:nucleoside deaminase [Alphaproteobacteria bacterium]